MLDVFLVTRKNGLLSVHFHIRGREEGDHLGASSESTFDEGHRPAGLRGRVREVDPVSVDAEFLHRVLSRTRGVPGTLFAGEFLDRPGLGGEQFGESLRHALSLGGPVSLDLRPERPAEGPRGQGPQHPLEGAPVRLVRGPRLDLVEGLADVDHSCTPVGNSSRATPSSPAGIRWL